LNPNWPAACWDRNFLEKAANRDKRIRAKILADRCSKCSRKRNNGNMLGKSRLCFTAAMLLIFTASAWAQSDQPKELERNVIEDRLRQYAGLNPARAITMMKLFAEAGCSGERLEEQPVNKAEAPNVVCRLPGAGNGVIIVGAHFDRVPAGEGVADNWSGASLLPSLYQSLSSMPRRHTFVFISFTGEEMGFVGSNFYANQLTENEAARVKAMINLDTLGLGPTEIWVSDSDPGLVEKLTVVAAELKLPLRGMNVDGTGDSDGRPFKSRDIPVITLHSVTAGNLKILHSAEDNFASMKLDDYYDSYRLIAAYLAALDSALAK
jgi:hypothetical protein